MTVDIEKLIGEHIANIRAASSTRLRLKKHDALVKLIDKAAHGLQQQLKRAWVELEDEESKKLEEEIAAAEEYVRVQVPALPTDAHSDVSRALYQSLSPLVEGRILQGLRSDMKSLTRLHEEMETIEGSDSTGDLDEEIEARPRKQQRLQESNASEALQSPKQKTSSRLSSDRLVPSGTPSSSTPASQCSDLRAVESSDPGSSMSTRKGLRRAKRASGSYDIKQTFRDMGIGRALRRTT